MNPIIGGFLDNPVISGEQWKGINHNWGPVHKYNRNDEGHNVKVIAHQRRVNGPDSPIIGNYLTPNYILSGPAVINHTAIVRGSAPGIKNVIQNIPYIKSISALNDTVNKLNAFYSGKKLTPKEQNQYKAEITLLLTKGEQLKGIPNLPAIGDVFSDIASALGTATAVFNSVTGQSAPLPAAAIVNPVPPVGTGFFGGSFPIMPVVLIGGGLAALWLITK